MLHMGGFLPVGNAATSFIVTRCGAVILPPLNNVEMINLTYVHSRPTNTINQCDNLVIDLYLPS
jgi:hypothetical protein